MADRNRRSSDDERDDAFDDAAFDDAASDDDDGDRYDDDGDTDTDEAGAPARRRSPSRSGAAAGTRQVARPRGKDDQRPGLIGRIVNFVREVVAELQKVIWPTRKELITYTVVVIVFVTIVMTFVALLDVGFAKVMFFVFGGATSSSG